MIAPLASLLSGRRSIRKYMEKEVPETHIREMVESAMLAASPSNRQPVRYLRLASVGVREELAENVKSGYEKLLKQAGTLEKPRKVINVLNHYYRHSCFMENAPALFAVGFERGDEGFSGRLKRAGMDAREDLDIMGCDISLGLSLQSFMLKAVELGLGTCILTAPLHFLKGHESFAGLEDFSLRCFLTVGYAREIPDASPKKELNEIYREL